MTNFAAAYEIAVDDLRGRFDDSFAYRKAGTTHQPAKR